MKNYRAVLMLGLSLLAGLIAVLLAARWLTQQQASAPPQQMVVAAAADIGIGQVLNGKMIELVPWSAATLPKGAYTDLKQLEGRVAIAELARGELVLENKLAPVGTKGGLSAVIPDGKRAISVRVNEVVGVAGFTLPGNFVDVMVNMELEPGKQISKIVLERIMVLAVAQQANRDDTAPKVVGAVTLEVTPDQAEKLDLARSIGNLSLVLRNQIDTDTAETSGARKEMLLGRGLPLPPAAASTASASQPAVLRVPRSAPKVLPATAPEDSAGSVEMIRGMQRSAAPLQ